MGSTGEVAVEKSLGLNSQEQALEFAATTQAADQPNIPQQEGVFVPTETVQVTQEQEATDEGNEEEKQSLTE